MTFKGPARKHEVRYMIPVPKMTWCTKISTFLNVAFRMGLLDLQVHHPRTISSEESPQKPLDANRGRWTVCSRHQDAAACAAAEYCNLGKRRFQHMGPNSLFH